MRGRLSANSTLRRAVYRCMPAFERGKSPRNRHVDVDAATTTIDAVLAARRVSSTLCAIPRSCVE